MFIVISTNKFNVQEFLDVYIKSNVDKDLKVCERRNFVYFLLDTYVQQQNITTE